MVSLLMNDTFMYKEYLNQSLFTVISSLLRKHSNIIYNGLYSVVQPLRYLIVIIFIVSQYLFR